jgi:hypothetical protein
MPDAPVADPVAPDPAAAPPAPPAKPPAPSAPKEPVETPEEKIARLEAEVTKVRDEAAKARIGKKSAVDEAKAELAQQFGKALGLVPDDAADPAKLLEQSNVFKTQARQAEIQLAVYQAADAVNGDPQALLDSRTFLARVAEIDPSDSAALETAIHEAVTMNPRLGKPTAPAPGPMRPNPAQGSSGSSPQGLAGQIKAAEQAGDTKTALRLKAARQLEMSHADRSIQP